MESALVLSSADLVALTSRARPSAQTRVLRRLGIPFLLHPVDRIPIVSRAAAMAALGDTGTLPVAPAIAQEYEVNVSAILNHGKKAHTRQS